MKQPRWSTVLILGMMLGLCAAPVAFADVKLPSVIGDNMVLQQGKPLPIWGWANAGEKVTVKLGKSRSAKTTADDNGKWMVKLKSMKAGGPYTLTVSGNNTIELKNILIGEVWVCSGQSNMQWTVGNSNNSKMEIAAANYPKIRLFYVPRTIASQPQDDVNAKWEECTSQNVGEFSAVSYFFGRTLHQELDIPIGLIHTSWGGTPAEAWTSLPSLQAEPILQPIVERWDKSISDFNENLEKYEQDFLAWKKESINTENTGGGVGGPPSLPNDPRKSPHRYSGLYNAMIAPLIPYAIQGAIWYQGESNATRAYQYRTLFPAMITDWRKNWGQGDFTFLFVQLANFEVNWGNQSDVAWAELEEAQLMTLDLPNTGMSVTIDIGDPKDIHPRNKQEVGRRLALAARAIAYGQDIVYSGPIYKDMRVEGNRIRLSFNHIGGGLIVGDPGELQQFTIAGEDRNFVPAKAEIDGETVIVSAEGVPQPVAVRYAFDDNPESANLYNKEGLPASPFRTDIWPGVTVDAR